MKKSNYLKINKNRAKISDYEKVDVRRWHQNQNRSHRSRNDLLYWIRVIDV